MNTSELIRFYRKDRKLTQKQLATKCGTSAAMIRQYELGLRHPKIETINTIAQALDICPSNLYSSASNDGQKTKTCKCNEYDNDSCHTMVTLLAQIYGHAEYVPIGNYISIGIGESKQALSISSLNKITELLEYNLKEIVSFVSEDEQTFLSSNNVQNPYIL